MKPLRLSVSSEAQCNRAVQVSRGDNGAASQSFVSETANAVAFPSKTCSVSLCHGATVTTRSSLRVGIIRILIRTISSYVV